MLRESSCVVNAAAQFRKFNLYYINNENFENALPHAITNLVLKSGIFFHFFSSRVIVVLYITLTPPRNATDCLSLLYFSKDEILELLHDISLSKLSLLLL